MAAAPIDWMMLEPFVFRRDDNSSFPDDGTAPFRAQGISSYGGPFTIAFCIVEPPAISRLYLQWPGGPKEGSSCDLVTGHRNLLLFRLTSSPVRACLVNPLHKGIGEDWRGLRGILTCRGFNPPQSTPIPFKPLASEQALKGKDESLICPQEYFICEGGPPFPPRQQPLQLHPIPMCNQRTLHLRSVGILCGGEEKYVIAQLCLSESNLPAKMEAELCTLRSNKWKLLKNLPIKCEAHELFDLIHWRTDRVICFQNNLCWISYFCGGILFCDVLKKKPKISYLRLPIHGQCRSTDLHRLQDMNCSLCITDSGSKLMFIDVAPEDNDIVGPMFPGTDYVVTCHTLRREESCGMVWEKVFFIKSHELWGFNASLPCNAPMFPLVSVTKSNELYFLLSEEGEHVIDKVSVIALDTINKVVTIHQYIKGEADLGGEDDDMVRQKSRLLHPFVPSEFPKFLGPTR